MFGVNAVDTNNKTRLYYNERNLFNEEVLKEVMSQGKAKRIIKFVGNKSSMGKYKNRKFNRRLRRYMDDISRFAKMGKSYGKKRRDAAKAELLKISGE